MAPVNIVMVHVVFSVSTEKMFVLT